MSFDQKVSTANGNILTQTYHQHGFMACIRKAVSAVVMSLPVMFLGHRTNASVGAYFDLVTDDGRMFYGDDFHFGFFHSGARTLEEGLGAHTDLVAEMACLEGTNTVLDVGCGICAPAIRIAGSYDGSITGVNISREQVRHGNSLIEENGLTGRVRAVHGNALDLDFEDESFDSILCLEVAGDICVTGEQKEKLVDELHRVLKPGGHIGFSDLVFTGKPSRKEEKSMRKILYHEGRELITDWHALFRNRGFAIERQMDLIEDTMETWDHFIAVYEEKSEEVGRRYGKRIAASSLENIRRIPDILRKYGSFTVMSLHKPPIGKLS